MIRDDKRVPVPPNDDDAAADPADSADSADSELSAMTDPHQDRLMIVRGRDRRRTERTAMPDDVPAQSPANKASEQERAAHVREDAADLRDGLADLREDAVHLREDAATSREQDIGTAETKQAASNDHMATLLQANEGLVVSTIEAHILTEQLQATQAQLEHAKLAAEKANLAKSKFLSSMSHELRTPLNAILGFAQLLEVGSPPPTAAQTVRLQQITQAGWYLLDLINDILDLAVVESGKLSLSLEPVLLIDIMRECEFMIEPQSQQRGIQISFPPFDPAWQVNVDRVRVKQALINLLSNAVKYNRENGTVEVRCSRVSPERIRISIKDSGVGLPPHQLEQLFQPFNRLGQEHGSVEGTGIGLVVTKQLVEQMGGAIGVESAVGVGSEFWIELNVDTMPHLATGNPLPAKCAPQTRENTMLRTLLYVEDNPANLLLVEHIIEDHTQLHMLSARDGNQGIALARTHIPDVILMDINLPGMSGIEALKVLHDDPITAYIPVIALSANAMPCDIEKGLKAGFFNYLTKPIKVSAFMEALDKALACSEQN
ncbi:MAG: response regulator [Sulfuriferula multivorans]|uniref:histidine kinase n=1 Tax=Sulfuriferula multivorans TaxID=1559896 RepID=A0A7C9P8P0_9PROT|nr:response regulator [Sulfuriferula multivorans]